MIIVFKIGEAPLIVIYDRISQNMSPNNYFEYSYPNSNGLLQSCLKLKHCHPRKCDVINDVILFQQFITGFTVTNFLRYPNVKSVKYFFGMLI